ncbi:MAG: CBS domain-containing protein [Ruminococcus sp.]|nr:CBS domain-containing protein [Ruminococcus sp.]
MNVIKLLKTKDTVKYIHSNNTLRQGLEKMRANSYTAIPVITKDDGKYVGTVSEGDFLYYILDVGSEGMKEQEHYYVRDILRKDFNPAVKIDVTMDELLERAMQQNFIPVVDDTGTFIGIVTRQDIIKYFIHKQEEK